VECQGTMNDIQKNIGRMGINSKQNSRTGWSVVRDFCRSLKRSYGDNNAWRISWIARCTWIPAFDKATGRKGNNRRLKIILKHRIVSMFAGAYILIIFGSAIATVALWK
jgi:hypothetical protein